MRPLKTPIINGNVNNMKQLILNYVNSINRRTRIVILVVIAVLIVGYWPVSYIYNTLQEHYLVKKYAADPEWKHVTDQMEVNKRDLANNPDRYKRIAATMDMGLEWYNLREFKFAAKWWKKGLAIEPNNIIGWNNLGNAYRDLKQFSKAEVAYRKSMKLARVGEVDACLALGEQYRFYDKSKQDKADDLYLECLKKHKDDRDLIARLADYYRDMGNIKNAILYFDKLYMLEPTQEVSEELRSLRSMGQ